MLPLRSPLRLLLLIVSLTHVLWLYRSVFRLAGGDPNSRTATLGLAERFEDLASGSLLGRSLGAQTLFSAPPGLDHPFVEQDGLLYFQPTSAIQAALGTTKVASKRHQLHPILYLIQRAEKQWQDMLARQSKTLDQAVNEYRRRYNRNPPKGFNLWWQFCEGEGVQLPDEYDTIMEHLEPFFALPPGVLRQRAITLATDPDFRSSQDSFTYSVRNHQASVSAFKDRVLKSSRTAGFVRFMTILEPLLPDMNVTITSHDGPNQMIPGELKARYAAFAKEGKFLTKQEASQRLDPRSNGFFSWSAGCEPDTRIRRQLAGEFEARPSTHSFVLDVSASSSVCAHPENQDLHGVFLTQQPEPGLLYPHFAWTKTATYSDILVTPLEQYYRQVEGDPAWADKKVNKLLWRGATTGLSWNKNSRWRRSQRARLVMLGSPSQGQKEVHYAGADGSQRSVVEDLASLSDRLMNVAFAGNPAQCIEKDGTCAAMLSTFNFTDRMGPAQQFQHKYIFDMDGNGWSGRFHQLLSSNSAILKSTAVPEWYSKRIMPWVHFIPVKLDYTDLHDILAFFIGNSKAEHSHDDLGERIGRQGKEWAETFWREVDMQAYMLRLLLEYNRLLVRTEEEPTNGDYIG